MPFYFYLSHALADNTPYIRKFFEDLSDTLRSKLGLPRDEKKRVGFYEQRSIPRDSGWSGQLAKALQTSRVMISLLSPAYFQSIRAGREWQLFEMRRQLRIRRAECDGNYTASIPQFGIPIVWIPWQGSPPNVISEMQPCRYASNSVYSEVGLLGMLNGKFSKEYASFVIMLADQIIEISSRASLPPLDSLPKATEVQSIFHTANKLTSNTTASLEKFDKYKVIFVEDDEPLRELFVECSRLNNFEAEGYDEAERILHEIFFDPLQQKMPDLFVIDLELQYGKMQGIELIKELTDRNVPSLIMAVSGNLPTSSLLEAMKSGARVALPKPFGQDQLLEKMKPLAEIGKKRRVHQQAETSSNGLDTSRFRPVFLSYSDKDRILARVLKSYIEDIGIGVWYAPDSVQPGDIWRPRIQNAIDQVSVFIALITNNYAKSKPCVGELTRFCDRLKTENDPSLLILPVIDGSLEEIRKSVSIKSVIEKYHCIDISQRFVDVLTGLLVRIQRAMNQN